MGASCESADTVRARRTRVLGRATPPVAEVDVDVVLAVAVVRQRGGRQIARAVPIFARRTPRRPVVHVPRRHLK